MSYIAKSIIIDIADNHGHADYVGLRSVEFLFDGLVIAKTAADFTAQATSQLATFYEAPFAFDTSLAKAGSNTYQAWRTDGVITNVRISVVFDDFIVFDQVVINNTHFTGTNTTGGANNVVISASHEEVFSTVYQEAIPSQTIIYDGVLREHVATDSADNEVLTLIPLATTPRPTTGTSQSTGKIYPTSAVHISDTSGGLPTWTTPTNILVQDDTPTNTTDERAALFVSGFDFGFPAGAVIDGFIVELRGYAGWSTEWTELDDGARRDMVVKTTKNTGTVHLSENTVRMYAGLDSEAEATKIANTVTVGGATDLLGMAWDTDTTATGFGLILHAGTLVGWRYVDVVSIEAYYSIEEVVEPEPEPVEPVMPSIDPDAGLRFVMTLNVEPEHKIIPIINLTVRRRSGSPSYIQATIPYTLINAELITNNSAADISLWVAGSSEPVITGKIDTIQISRGVSSQSIVVSARRQTTNAAPATHALTGITSVQDGTTSKTLISPRYDPTIQPGDTVSFDGVEFVVGLETLTASARAAGFTVQTVYSSGSV